MRINPGSLDKVLQFRRRVLADDGFASNPVFSDHGDTVRGRKRDISDGERMAGGELVATSTVRFIVRVSSFTADLSPMDELVCDGIAYVIRHKKALDDGSRWYEFTAAARADG